MQHPTDGTLRRLVDEPAGVPDPDRQHVAGCPVCLTGLAEARQTAAATAAALDTTVVPDVDRAWQRLSAGAAPTPAAATAAALDTTVVPDVDRAWQRLSAGTAHAPAPVRSTAPASRWRRAVRSPAIAAVGVVLVLGGAGAAAAGDWLQVFHTDSIEA